jgi:hypothetical protein
MGVMPIACGTCPFTGTGGAHVIRPEAKADYLTEIVTLQSSHLCHTADNKKLCRGGRDIQLSVMVARGLIDEPTDECLDREMRKTLGI